MRLIAKLDVKPPYVVKPVHFEGLRKVGEPAYLAKKYYEDGADEIFYIDIVSSLYRREILYKEILQTADGIFVPLAVGGGVKTLEDFSQLFRSGADKVVVNTHVLQNDPSLIDQAAKVFGSQSVVINIEAKKIGEDWVCYSDCGRIPSTRKVFDWIKEVADRGAGEILLQSVDRDGRQRGFDIELIAKAVELVDIPVVACSGAGSLEDILAVAKEARPSAIALASVLHYEKISLREIKSYFPGNRKAALQ